MAETLIGRIQTYARFWSKTPQRRILDLTPVGHTIKWLVQRIQSSWSLKVSQSIAFTLQNKLIVMLSHRKKAESTDTRKQVPRCSIYKKKLVTGTGKVMSDLHGLRDSSWEQYEGTGTVWGGQVSGISRLLFKPLWIHGGKSWGQTIGPATRLVGRQRGNSQKRTFLSWNSSGLHLSPRVCRSSI